MPKNKKKFRQILVELIEDANMTKVEFYTELGIKKPYFYDIISGKASPPPPERQLDMIKILKPPKEKMIKFFDSAAEERKEVPIDIVKQLENKQIVKNIRNKIDYEKLIKTGENKK